MYVVLKTRIQLGLFRLEFSVSSSFDMNVSIGKHAFRTRVQFSSCDVIYRCKNVGKNKNVTNVNKRGKIKKNVNHPSA